MNLATWSIRNPIPVVLLFILLTLAGLWGFRALPIQRLPDLDLPRVSITLSQPGAAPAQLETEVARPVEDSLATLSGLKHIRTAITDGQVTIDVDFILEKRLSDALMDTKDAVDRVRPDLPTDLREPTVSAVTVGGGPILAYSVASARLDEEALSWFVDDTVGKAVLAVPGVGRFERLGGVQREVRVDVDPVRLAALDITVGDVSRALRRTRQDASGGRGQLGDAEQSVRTVAAVPRAADLAALPIVLPDGRHLSLDRIAVVSDAIADRTRAALHDGAPVVGFRVYRAKGFDETAIADGVNRALEGLSAADPSLRVSLVSSRVVDTLEQYDGSMHMLYEGAVLAVIVVWWFLRDWRATLIAAAALPLSILPAFAAMAWLGYSLNTLTLLALAVVVGILVDDAIVEIENIERHRRAGKPMLKATADAVTEIALAVIATTMCLVAVFLPTAFMGGVPGLLFRQFAWTAAIAVLASLLVARLLTPMMAAHILVPHTRDEPEDGPVMRWYLGTVRRCLAHRGVTIAAAGAFFVASLALLPLIPRGLIPPADGGFVTVGFELPPGSSLRNSLEVSEAARAVLGELPGVDSVFTAIGDARRAGGGGAAGEVHKGSLTLTLAPRAGRPHRAEIEAAARMALQRVPGARFAVGDGVGAKLELILAGENAAALTAGARALTRDLRAMDGLSNIASSVNLDRPEILIQPDARRAAERGVTTAAIAETVRIATSGDFDAQVARLDLDTRRVYIRVRVAETVRRDLEALGNLRVSGRDGVAVPLSAVATLSLGSGPARIDRYDRRRHVTVDADLGDLPPGTVLAAVNALPSVQGLPSGVALIRAGDAEIAGDLATGFGMAIPIGVLCVLCVLILLFRNVFQPLTILSALPLSLGGAFVALLAAGSELNVPSMIGLVMLMGIVTKNSILLVEHAVAGRRDHGISLHDALVDACHKRARPIVMTTVAMAAGMLPIALGLGADAGFRQPMAVAVIGGLLTSTALSLLVVPAVFVEMDRAEQALMRLTGRARRGAAGVPGGLS
ncbi:efflux RND transporter permease subunit [Azospirillum halopraeferens]|uniref:efflux RND transporter permease subunit n=1 Tax=Azospirillum halopraeferens TaxID=34010 RepID=UPI0004033262|nr:efflux RND transporter permease subunit [Azospirillum halopraeferens]